MGKVPITPLELYPIVVAMYVWGKHLTNRSICMYTDNFSLVYIINKQSSKDPCIMKLLRFMILHCLKYNILFRAKHLTSKENKLSDLLSRLQVQQFKQLHQTAEKFPTEIPDSVHHRLFFP